MQNDNLEKRSNIQILKGSGMAYLATAVNIISGIVYTPWMIRQIGQSSYGLYTLAVSLISLLMFDFGIGTALTRFAARFRAEEDTTGLEKFIGMVYKMYFLLDAVILAVCCTLFFMLGTMYKNLTPGELATFRVIFVMVVGYNLIAFPLTTLEGVLGAYEEFAVLKGCQLLTRVLTIIFVVVSLAAGFGLYALVLANILSGLLTLAFKWWYVHKKLHIRILWNRTDTVLLKEVMGFSLWSTVGGTAGTLCTNLMPSFVAAAAGTAETAIYGAAQTLNGYAYYLTSAVGGLFLPKVTRILKGESAEENLTKLAIRVGRILMYICAIVLVGFFAVGDRFFVLWMGEDYRIAYYAACFLLCGEMIPTPNQVLTTAMTAAGCVKPVAINRMVTTIFIFAAGTVACSTFGAVGAAACIGIGYLVRGMTELILQGKYLKVDIGRYLWRIYGSAAPYLLLGIACRMLVKKIVISGWLILFVEIAAIVILYAAVTWFCVANSEEKRILRASWQKLRKRKEMRP